MKSALELAMERTGGGPKLTPEQKRKIEEIRSVAKAKVAEEEIMVAKKIGGMNDPAAIGQLKGQSAALIRKIEADAEAKVEKVRGGGK